MKDLKELEDYHFVPNLVLPPTPPPPQSPKCFSLKEGINNTIPVNRPATELKGRKGKYDGKESEAAWKGVEGRPMYETTSSFPSLSVRLHFPYIRITGVLKSP